ncbi:ankyrin repeat-containing domain protein [Coprinopsis sp. MPI-PUGE-AT-0042]|nr:ankyrin repeat-containing domain protein [Coprinopsis sp. MPI-PUGE-AT-0042]
MLAATRGSADMVKALLQDSRIDVNLQDEDGNTALMLAAAKGWSDMVKALLLDPRIEIHKRNEKDETALHCAIHGTSNGHTAAALYLIAIPEIDINAADDHGQTPLMLAYGHPQRLLNSLAKHPGIDLLKRDKNGCTPLMHACRWGTSSTVQWYLRLPGVDARDHLGASAMTHRAQHTTQAVDHLSDFRALAAAGLNINETDTNGFTALTHAFLCGSSEAFGALLQLEDIDVNLEDREGRTLLMIACEVPLKHNPRHETSTNGEDCDPLALLLSCPTLDIHAGNQQGTSIMACVVARAVLATAEELLSFASHSSEPFPSPVERHEEVLDRMGPFFEVPELAVHIQPEEPVNQRPGMSAEIIATGTKSPYPPDFRLLHCNVLPHYRHAIVKSEACALRFPWKTAWISEKHAGLARLLFKNHPSIDYHSFGWLRFPPRPRSPFLPVVRDIYKFK